MNSHVTVVEFVLAGIGIFFLGLSFHLQGRVKRLRDENRSLKYLNRCLQSSVDSLQRQNMRQVYRLRELVDKLHNYTQVDPGNGGLKNDH